MWDLDDRRRNAAIPPDAWWWGRAGARRWWFTPDAGGDALGAVNLSVEGPPGPQAALLLDWLVCFAASPWPSPAESAAIALSDRPYPNRLGPLETLRVDAVRATAVALRVTRGLSGPLPAGGLPAVAAARPIDEQSRAFAAWFEWLSQPSPHWSSGEQIYHLEHDDRALMLVGLLRSTTPEAFTWYRSGVPLIDAALATQGRLDGPIRSVWVQLLETRPGARDWHDWHDALVQALPEMRAARRAPRLT